MSLLTRLFPERKTFEGTVTEVQLVDGFFESEGQYHKYPKHNYRDIKGYDGNGTPIKDEYTVTHYRATVQNAQGETKTFERFGRVPVTGTCQTYRMRDEWKGEK